MLVHMNIDLLSLKLLYFVLENDNFVLEMFWKCPDMVNISISFRLDFSEGLT
jgi:hypothetical protein